MLVNKVPALVGRDTFLFVMDDSEDDDQLENLWDRFNSHCEDRRVASTISALRHCLSHENSADIVSRIRTILCGMEKAALGSERKYTLDDLFNTYHPRPPSRGVTLFTFAPVV